MPMTNVLELHEIGKLPHFVYISDCGCGVNELVSSCTSVSNLPKKRKNKLPGIVRPNT